MHSFHEPLQTAHTQQITAVLHFTLLKLLADAVLQAGRGPFGCAASPADDYKTVTLTRTRCNAVCYAALGIQEGSVNRHCCRPVSRVDVISLLSDEPVGAQIPTSGIPMLWDGDHWLYAVVCFMPVVSKLYPDMFSYF